MHRRSSSICLATIVALGTSSVAYAGETPGAPPVIVVETPPPPVQSPPPAYGGDPAYGGGPAYGTDPAYGQPAQAVDPGYGYAQQPAPMPQAPIAAPVYVPHLRWGVSILGGVTETSGDAAGGASGLGGASVRIGVQINPSWGVYLNETGLVGGYVLAGYSWASTVVFATAYTSIMGSYTVGNRLELALGPSADALSAVSVNVTSSGGTAVGAYEGTAFGLHLRAALMLGRSNVVTGGRSGFSLSFEAHPTFYGGFTLTTLSIGLGGDWY